MDPVFIHITLFFAGISLTLGVINLILGLGKNSEKAYLYFGLLGIFSAGYYLLSTMVDGEEYGIFYKMAIISFMVAFISLPWFFSSYTSYENKKLKWIISGLMLASLIVLLFTNKPHKLSYWNILAHLSIIGILVYGFISTRKMLRTQTSKGAWLLFGLMIILTIITLDDIWLVHFRNTYHNVFHQNVLLLDYMPIFFMIVMGPKLVGDFQQKYIFEKQYNASSRRWMTLLENVHLIVVSLNKKGNISYANPYFLKLANLNKEDILGKNWFQTFLPEKDKDEVLAVFNEQLSNPQYEHFENPIQLLDGSKLQISWSNVNLYDDDNNVTGLITIGSDITKRESAIKEILLLKEQLEKENLKLREEILSQSAESEIIGESDTIKFIIQRALQVATTSSTVLLEGETGSGKEVFANLIHKHSKRKKMPFVKVNCSALSKELIESELFGHERGSFTGAIKNRQGRFELADKGTLFLDEIGELPLELQPKLLRVLQTGEFEPVGSEKTKKVDVRIITATNRLLYDEAKKGSFREDLYYRLSVYPITIPSLRQRKDDIPLFVNHFVNAIGKRIGKDGTQISKADNAKLQDYDWPGNVRELENVIERALIVSSNGLLKIDLPKNSMPVNPTANDTVSDRSLDEHQRQLILETIKACNWKINGDYGAAAILKIHPNTLRSRMKKLNIERPK